MELVNHKIATELEMGIVKEDTLKSFQVIIERMKKENGIVGVTCKDKQRRIKKNMSEVANMLRLRPYKSCDAGTIISWCKDEESFRKWTSDRYESFPITADDMNKKYMDYNGDCEEEDNFYPMTAFDETGVVGHLILRYSDEEKKTIRFGFVIVDDTKRGMGYGKEMLKLAQRFAFDVFRAEKITLGVFEKNPSAYYCYKAAGFRDVAMSEEIYCSILGEQWKLLELELSKNRNAEAK